LQGYIFSRPIPAVDFHAMLLEGRKLNFVPETSAPAEDLPDQ